MTLPSPARTLAIDIGNSRIKFGLLSSAGAAGELPHLEDSFAVRHDEAIPWNHVQAWVDQAGIKSGEIVVASVNPPALDQLQSDWPTGSLPPPEVIRSFDQLKLSIQVDAPERVGIDRLLNAVAANRLRRSGEPMMIIGSGTAGTIDLLDPSGTFIGGAIFSGLEMTARSLHDYTAQLPLLTVEELRSDSPEALGKNTRSAMHAGIFWGHVGAVKELIARLGDQFPQPTGLILTGGAARMLIPHLPAHAQLIPHLVLYGLATTVEQRVPVGPRG